VLRKTVAAFAFVLVVVIAWDVRHRAVPARDSNLSMRPILQFSLRDVNNQPIDLAQLKGKVVLIDFWAMWCAPCEAEIPQFVEWQKRYGEQGLQVIGLSMDDAAPPVKAYAQEHGISYPIGMADDKTIAAFGGVLGLPAYVLIDREGRLIAKHVGVTDIHVLQREAELALRTSGN
jgi:cytochrome c biogenesis protein CcmG, thiol:disulfide interchange protein DsbE